MLKNLAKKSSPELITHSCVEIESELRELMGQENTGAQKNTFGERTKTNRMTITKRNSFLTWSLQCKTKHV